MRFLWFVSLPFQFFALVFFALATRDLADKSSKYSNLRRPNQVLGLTILAMIIAVYFSWSFHPLFSSGDHQTWIAWSPWAISDWMNVLFAESGWGWFKPVLLSWLGQAFFLFLITVLTTDEKTCESCNLIPDVREHMALFSRSNDDFEMVDRIKSGDYRALLDLQPAKLQHQSINAAH